MDYIQCVSGSCDYPIELGWDFCPACGTDNRMPSLRRKIPHHHHRYVIRTGYCIKCGDSYDEPYSFGYRWRARLVLISILSGLVALATAGLIQLGHAIHNTSIGRWVATWYTNPVTHRAGRRYSRYTYTNELGYDLTLWLCVGGGVLIVLGVLMLFKVPFETGDDTGGRWRVRSWWL